MKTREVEPDGVWCLDLDDPATLREIVRKLDPRDIMQELSCLDRQGWYDRLKAEAVRLGVKP